MSSLRSDEFVFTRSPEITTQAGRILAHLRSVGPITPLEALELYGCFRLAARIKDLRVLGWKIDTTQFHTPTGKSVAKYWLL